VAIPLILAAFRPTEVITRYGTAGLSQNFRVSHRCSMSLIGLTDQDAFRHAARRFDPEGNFLPKRQPTVGMSCSCVIAARREIERAELKINFNTFAKKKFHVNVRGLLPTVPPDAEKPLIQLSPSYGARHLTFEDQYPFSNADELDTAERNDDVGTADLPCRHSHRAASNRLPQFWRSRFLHQILWPLHRSPCPAP
jgi:hypothetical protein